MGVKGKLIVTLNDDGTVSTNATQLEGTDAEMLKALTDLAKELGGELKVEKHLPGLHGHSHSHSRITGRGHSHK